MTDVVTGDQWIYVASDGTHTQVMLPVKGARVMRKIKRTSKGRVYTLAIEARWAMAYDHTWEFDHAFFEVDASRTLVFHQYGYSPSVVVDLVSASARGAVTTKRAKTMHSEGYGDRGGIIESEQGWMRYLVALARLQPPSGLYPHKSLLLDALTQDADALRRLGMANYFELREAWGETVRANPRRRTR